MKNLFFLNTLKKSQEKNANKGIQLTTRFICGIGFQLMVILLLQNKFWETFLQILV